jgi:hypothetical protein
MYPERRESGVWADMLQSKAGIRVFRKETSTSLLRFEMLHC